MAVRPVLVNRLSSLMETDVQIHCGTRKKHPSKDIIVSNGQDR